MACKLNVSSFLNPLCRSVSLHLSPPSPTAAVDSTTSCNCFQLKHNYCKFLSKTQSLDIVDEAAITNIVSSENCFESINEELMLSAPSDEPPQKSMLPRVTSLDNNSGCQRPIFPNLSYSPYGSPRTSRKPAHESRRISTDKNGSFLQLNQYKLMDQIGVVICAICSQSVLCFTLKLFLGKLRVSEVSVQ